MISIIGTRSHHLCLVFYFGFVSSFVSVVPMLIYRPVLPNWTDVGALSGVVLFAYLGQITLNCGLQMTSSTATLMRNLDIVFAFMYSYFIFNEMVTFTSILGALLICIGTCIIMINKYNNHRSNSDLEQHPSSPTLTEPLLKKE